MKGNNRLLADETEISPENNIKERRLSYYWPFGLALGIYGLDQFTKWLTETNLGPFGSGKEAEFLGGLVVFKYVKNTGASFSIDRKSVV